MNHLSSLLFVSLFFSALPAAETLFTTGGWPRKGALALKGGGTGDVTDKILWKSKIFSYVPTPAIAKDALYLRSNKAIYCIGK